ncbi:MAG: M15 family metallopeptidase [Burkholderiaceae bacterium]
MAFTACLAELIQMAEEMGYEMALGEGMDRVTAKDPTTDHRPGSLHEIGLAQDIDLYRHGLWLSKTEDHLPFGEYWEEMGKLRGYPLAWGGRFSKPDGNHYSLKWRGRS